MGFHRSFFRRSLAFIAMTNGALFLTVLRTGQLRFWRNRPRTGCHDIVACQDGGMGKNTAVRRLDLGYFIRPHRRPEVRNRGLSLHSPIWCDTTRG